MAIKGKTFDLQTITAKDDGALYRILSGESDMIVFSGSGTALSINSNILTIAECYLLVGGRYIHIEDGSTIDLGTIPNSSNRGRVILKIDTSLGATQVTLDQVVPEIETIASGGSYRALVQNDINSDNGGSVYEIEFATFTCSSGVASSPALTTSVSTQTKIQALQDDIDTLADNLEQTGSDVGDLQTDVTALKNLGLSVPIPIAKGGTGGTSRLAAQRNLILSETNNTTLIEGTSSQIGAMGFSVCYYNKAQYTGSHSEALPTNWGVLVSFCNTYNDEWSQLWLAQGGSDMYRRSGNSASTPSAVTWTKI